MNFLLSDGVLASFYLLIVIFFLSYFIIRLIKALQRSWKTPISAAIDLIDYIVIMFPLFYILIAIYRGAPVDIISLLLTTLYAIIIIGIVKLIANEITEVRTWI